MEEERFGTEMYDQKYAAKDETEPRSVVASFVDQHLDAGTRCLDLGCGAGRHSQYLVEKGIHVTAVDRSQRGVEKTKAVLAGDPESSALVADIHQLPFENESFESVISNRVLDYNDDAGLEAAFAEIARVTKDNSPIFITLRSITQPPKENEALVSENATGGKTYTVQSGLEQGACQHYFTEPEIRALARRYDLELQEINEVTKTNKHGEAKTEWQAILRKITPPKL